MRCSLCVAPTGLYMFASFPELNRYRSITPGWICVALSVRNIENAHDTKCRKCFFPTSVTAMMRTDPRFESKHGG